MFPLYQFPEGQIIAFALVFLRIIAFVIAWPVFGTNLVSAPVKILLALTLSVLLFPILKYQNADLIRIDDELLFLVIREIGVGLLLGYLMRMFFFAVSVAGEIISVSIGLASAQLYNPAMGSQSNVVEQFQLALATLFFLAIDGHHFFLSGLATSFNVVPVAAVGINYKVFSSVVVAGQTVLLLGFKMAAPVLVAIFMANISLGILGRAVPQLNVLVTSMPVTIMAGLGVLIISMPLFVGEMDMVLTAMANHFMQFMKVM